MSIHITLDKLVIVTGYQIVPLPVYFRMKNDSYGLVLMTGSICTTAKRYMYISLISTIKIVFQVTLSEKL